MSPTLTMHVLCNTNSNNFGSSHENFIKYMGLRHNALSSTAAVGSKLSQARKNPRQKLCCKKRYTRIRRFAHFLISYGSSTSCSAFLPHVLQKKPFLQTLATLAVIFTSVMWLIYPQFHTRFFMVPSTKPLSPEKHKNLISIEFLDIKATMNSIIQWIRKWKQSLGNFDIEDNSPFCYNLKQFPELNKHLKAVWHLVFFLLYICKLLKSEFVFNESVLKLKKNCHASHLT